MNNSFLILCKLKTVSSRSGGDNTAAIVGGVLGTVTVLAIMGMMIVVVILMRPMSYPSSQEEQPLSKHA